jgi:hypothetical protein
MEITIAERVENLEKAVNALTTKVSQLEALIVNIGGSQVNSPYSGNAFQRPYGNPFQYQPPILTPQDYNKHVNDIQSSSMIIQKLDSLLELFNNNFSRLNFRLDVLENERKE